MQLLATELTRLPINNSVYLIYGGEPLQTLEAMNTVRYRSQQQGFIERKVLELTNCFTLEQLTEHTQNFNLFASQQLLELRLKDEKIDLQTAKNLIQFITTLPPDTRVMIIANKLDNNTQKTKWFTTIQQIGCIIIAKPIPEERFPAWIIARLKQFNFTAKSEVVSLLSMLYFGNLVAIAQLIEKLALCLPAGELTLTQITPHLQNHADFNIFNLIDAAIDGDSKAVCHIFHSLKITKTEPTIILWAVAREIRTLIKIAFSLEQGKPYGEICKEYGIWASKSGKIRKYINNTSRQKLETILQKLTSIDAIIKGVQPGLIWESLLTVYLQFANIRQIETIETLTI